MTPRSSSRAWRAVERSSSAVSRTFAGGRSGRTSRAPACNASSEIRWASTSCISRAIRVRSAIRARSSCRRWSASARSGPLAQGEQKLPPGPDEHPPGGDGEHERDDPHEHRHRVGGGAVDGEEQDGRDPQRSDEQRRPDRTVHGEGEQREQPGGGGRDRERPQQQTGDRDAERPPPPPPQRQAGQHPAGDVDDNLRGRQRHDVAVQGRAQEQRPERDGDEAPGGVDGPVATGPLTGRARLRSDRRAPAATPASRARPTTGVTGT